MNSKRNRKKEGFLNVKLSTRSALGKAWKRKWVVVQQNTSSAGKSLLLELYQEKGAYHKTVTSLLLEAVVSVRRARSRSQAHAVEIASAARTLLAVSADSETETQDWLVMLRQNLLPPPAKEIACPPAIPTDFMRLSVIPSKDSEALGLEGDYLAHVSPTAINMYDTRTAEVALDWDLRHLKKFMLISKCHPLDAEKIVHILPSKRSPKGEGEFIFYSAKGKELVESIYERLSTAMTVKSRRSRSTSMLFEISPLELEQMLRQTEQPTLEEKPQEADGSAGHGAAAETEGGVNGDALAAASQLTPEAEDQAGEQQEEEAATADGDANGDRTEANNLEGGEESEQAEEVTEDTERRALEPSTGESNGMAAADGASPTSISQNADQNLPEGGSAEDEETERGDDDDKANQTNPEEMDSCTVNDPPCPGEANPAEPDQEPSELREDTVESDRPEPDPKDHAISQELPGQDEVTSPAEQEDCIPSEENPGQEDRSSEQQTDPIETNSGPTQGKAEADEPPNNQDKSTSEEQSLQDRASIPAHLDQEDGTPEVQPNGDDASTHVLPHQDNEAPEEAGKEEEQPSQDSPAPDEPSPTEEPGKEEQPSQDSPSPDEPSPTEDPGKEEEQPTQDSPAPDEPSPIEEPGKEQEQPSQDSPTSDEPSPTEEAGKEEEQPSQDNPAPDEPLPIEEPGKEEEQPSQDSPSPDEPLPAEQEHEQPSQDGPAPDEPSPTEEPGKEEEQPSQDGPAPDEPSPTEEPGKSVDESETPGSSSGGDLAAPDPAAPAPAVADMTGPSETEEQPAEAGNPKTTADDDDETSPTESAGPGQSESPSPPTPSAPDTASESEPTLVEQRAPSPETSPSAQETREVSP